MPVLHSTKLQTVRHPHTVTAARPRSNMDLRSIRYFIQIADLGSITRAAHHLRIAQPALSRHLKSLEDELGTELLVRLPRGVRLTGAGRQFVDHCRRILRELGRAQDELRASTETPQGRVVLGLSPTIGPLVLPGIVERATKQCPQVALKVVEGFSIQLYDALLAGRVDVGLLTNAAPSRALKLTPLISEPIVVLTAPAVRGSRRFFTLPELSKTPVFSTEAIRSIVDEQISRYGARLNIEAEIDAVEAIRRLLLRGLGPAVMPVSTFHDDVRAGNIAAMPIADANVQRILMLVQPAERKPTAAAEEIANILTTEVNELFDAGLFSLPAGQPQLIVRDNEARRAGRRTPKRRRANPA